MYHWCESCFFEIFFTITKKTGIHNSCFIKESKVFVFIIPQVRICKVYCHNLQFRELRQTPWFNGSLLNFFTGGYQLGKRISIPTRIYSFRDVSIYIYTIYYIYIFIYIVYICTDGIPSSRSTWDCTGMRSFRYQAQKYPKWRTIYVRRNSIVLLPFTVIEPTHGIAPECGIHSPYIQNAQSKPLWHFTEKGNKSKFHYVLKLWKLSYSKIRQFCYKVVLIDAWYTMSYLVYKDCSNCE